MSQQTDKKGAVLKAKQEQVNNMPALRTIEEAFKRHAPKAQVVDLGNEYWQNDAMTIVVAIDRKHIRSIAGLAHLATELQADECDTMLIGDDIVARFWWD